jgi:hypothetical protein
MRRRFSLVSFRYIKYSASLRGCKAVNLPTKKISSYSLEFQYIEKGLFQPSILLKQKPIISQDALGSPRDYRTKITGPGRFGGCMCFLMFLQRRVLSYECRTRTGHTLGFNDLNNLTKVLFISVLRNA